MSNVRFAHMTTIELVLMRADIKKQGFPEDKDFLYELEKELKERARERAREFELEEQIATLKRALSYYANGASPEAALIHFQSTSSVPSWEEERVEDLAAILDAPRYMSGPELNKWVATHHKAYMRASDADYEHRKAGRDRQ